MKRPKLIAALVIGTLASILIFQNTAPTTTNLFFWRWTLPHSLLLILAFGAGAATGSLVALSLGKKQRRNAATPTSPSPAPNQKQPH